MKRKDLVVGLLIGVLVMFLVNNFIAKSAINDTISYYETNISSQETKLKDVAKLLGRGAATSEIEFIVPECPLDEMVAYDSLLASLDNGLNKTQLMELSDLFNYCGDVAANRRSGAALQLEYEIEILKSYIEGRAMLGGKKVEDTDLKKWEDLAKKEREIAELFVRLVQSQDAIITTLLTGVSPTSINVENIRATAQKLREDLNVAVGEASQLRSSLLN
jgi:hypothetical protein